MKDLKMLATMLLLMVLSVGFTACGDDDDEPKTSSSIVGTWVEVTTGNDPITYRFNNDGSGTKTKTGITSAFVYFYEPEDWYLKISYRDGTSETFDALLQGNNYLSLDSKTFQRK